MTNDDTKRVRCYDDDKARINDRRRGPDDTQADVIRRLLDAYESEDYTERVAEVSPEISADIPTLSKAFQDALESTEIDPSGDLRDQLDRIEAAATTTEERTGRIEGTLEDLGGGR